MTGPNNYTRAIRAQQVKQIQVALVCPHCGAENRPGVTAIEIDDQSGTAWCSVCGTGSPAPRMDTT